MKKSMVLLLITVFLIISTSGNYSYVLNNNVKVYIDGEALVFDTKPVIVDGRTMIPLRAVFESLSMDVSWDSYLEKVTAENENLEITLFIGSKKPIVNGEVMEIDVASYIDNGRTMVPLRFIAESTGALVEWESQTSSVIITSKTNELSQSEITRNYKIVDTGVTTLYTDKKVVDDISDGESFYGQDSQYDSYEPSYSDNGDGTVTDNVTNLMWQQTMSEKMTYDDALLYANEKQLGGYSDWRIPTIKELFSLIIFTGESGGEVAKKLYIDTKYFDQPIGDTSIGEREIDAQTWSSTQYVSTTMKGDATVFGVNFIDGRIKGYTLIKPKTKADNKGYFRLVRGNEDYGKNDFVDNGDGTISDLATGLMWQLADDGETRNWQDALSYSESLDLAGYSDWRLPNIKELQSIVDYTKSVKTTQSPAIDSKFNLSKIVDPSGNSNYGFYWSSTTHQDGNNIASSASYVAFGEAQGEMNGTLMDVHGAGSVRSDPKSGSEANYPSYFGPQGDIRYVYNYVLSVRTIEDVQLELPIVEITKDLSDYNLFAPLRSTETYLMDMEENIAHTWSSTYNPGNSSSI
ncbi:MAG: DUF1566 domain-containing protein [Acidaminobacteraceae bacterium]